MEYLQEKEEALSLARERVAEAAEALEEILPDTAEELVWIRENIREELLSARTDGMASFDGMQDGVGRKR